MDDTKKAFELYLNSLLIQKKQLENEMRYLKEDLIHVNARIENMKDEIDVASKRIADCIDEIGKL